MQIVNSQYGKATGISILIHLLLGLAVSFISMAQQFPQAVEVAPTLVEIVPSRVLSMGDMAIEADAPAQSATPQQHVSSPVVPETPQPQILQESEDVPALSPVPSVPVSSVEPVKPVEPIIERGSSEAKGQSGDGDGQTVGRTANVLRGPAPKYPAAARKAGWEGTVLISILVDTNGLASTVTVRESSGYASLDNAAVKAVKKWRFSPATKNGIPIASLHAVRVRFRLTDRI